MSAATISTFNWTDARYDLADAIELWLEARPGKDYSRSQIARGVNGDLHEVGTVLGYLTADGGHVRVAPTSRGGYYTRYAWSQFLSRAS